MFDVAMKLASSSTRSMGRCLGLARRFHSTVSSILAKEEPKLHGTHPYGNVSTKARGGKAEPRAVASKNRGASTRASQPYADLPSTRPFQAQHDLEAQREHATNRKLQANQLNRQHHINLVTLLKVQL